MKFNKQVLIFIMLFSITLSLNAQKTEEVVWTEKYGWHEGATNVIPIEMRKGKPGYITTESYVLIANSNEGTIKIYKVTADGTLIENSTAKTKSAQNFKKGKWAITSYSCAELKSDYRNFLFISHSNYGEAEIYEINYDGTIGKKTWSKETWEKGIENVAIFSPMLVGQSSSIFLYKPNAGWAWVFEAKTDGTIGKNTWKSKNWVTGITGVVSFKLDHLFLTKPNGTAWVFKNNKGILEKQWKTDNYHKGISVVASCNHQNQSSKIFIGDPTAGKQWILQYDEIYKKSNVKWQNFDWEKNITLQAVINNGKNLLVLKPDIGAVWSYKIEN